MEILLYFLVGAFVFWLIGKFFKVSFYLLGVILLIALGSAVVNADDYEDLDINVKAVASAVTNALLTDSFGEPVKVNLQTKHKIFFNKPETGTGMARVQIPYVNNGKQTAQVQINWHNHKIVGVMYQARLGDKQEPVTGLNGKDIRTL